MIYDHDDIVTTADGKKHRVLWQVSRDAQGNQVELRCKSLHDKVARRIKVKNIVACEPRPHKIGEYV